MFLPGEGISHGAANAAARSPPALVNLMAGDDPLDEELTRRRTARGEHRAPPSVAVLVAVAAYAFLPQSLLLGPRIMIPALELALLGALVATNPWRLVRQARWSRWASVVLAGLVIGANLTALGMLISGLGDASEGSSLLWAAMQVWLTNVIGFALLYWELDRGGPVARRTERRDRLPPSGLEVLAGRES